MTVSYQLHAPTALPPWKEYGIHGIEDRMGLRIDLEALEKTNLLYLPGINPPVLGIAVQGLATINPPVLGIAVHCLVTINPPVLGIAVYCLVTINPPVLGIAVQCLVTINPLALGIAMHCLVTINPPDFGIAVHLSQYRIHYPGSTVRVAIEIYLFEYALCHRSS
jgi:hypothetical protein